MRPIFRVRRPIVRDLPEVRRVGWDTTAGYDIPEFCAVAMSDRISALFRAMGSRDRRDDPEELQLDFIVKMLENGGWRRWVPARGNLEAFVVRFAVIFLVDRRCRGERNRQRRAKIEVESHRRLARVPSYSPSRTGEAHEIIEKLARRADPEAVEAMDTVLASGGELPTAAARLGIDVPELKHRLGRVRAAAQETGVDVRLFATGPKYVSVQ